MEKMCPMMPREPMMMVSTPSHQKISESLQDTYKGNSLQMHVRESHKERMFLFEK